MSSAPSSSSAAAAAARVCPNTLCKCPDCSCGEGCTCNVSMEVVCDPCKDFKRAMQQQQQQQQQQSAQVQEGGATRRVELVAPSEALLSPEAPYQLRVDARTPAELLGQLGHVPTFVNVPHSQFLQAENYEQVAALLPAEKLTQQGKDTPILFICQSGIRAGQAAKRLVDLGFTRVGNVEGGMMKWNSLDLPRASYATDETRTDTIASLQPVQIRDMIAACFEDATARHAAGVDLKVSPTDLVRQVFEKEAGSWDAPPKEKFPDVIRSLGELAIEHHHPPEAIAENTSQFGSLVMQWIALAPPTPGLERKHKPS